MRPPNPARRLIHALEIAGQAAGLTIAWQEDAAVPWAHGLFTGTQLRLCGTGAPQGSLAVFAAALPEADLPIRGGCVADLTIDSITEEDDGTRVTLTALVIEA